MPAPAPTGIDYLRLVEDRHTRSVGERLQYAQLADPAPTPGPAEPPPAEPSAAEPSTAEPSTAEPSAAEPSAAEPSAAEPGAGHHRAPPDRDGLAYSADLLTLAGIGPDELMTLADNAPVSAPVPRDVELTSVAALRRPELCRTDPTRPRALDGAAPDPEETR